jgi:MoxR-like ATPase
MSDTGLRDACKRIEQHIDSDFALPQTGAWPATRHQLDEPPARAIIAAVAAGRPLLVRGEPGVGKSQLARAAAKLLQRPFLATVVQPDSEYQDLLWATDHTQRLADAQLAGHAQDAVKAAERVADPGNYIGPGALWWAYHWEDAEQQATRCRHNFKPPADIAASEVRKVGCVLLIDEIDKADIALANGLLEVLGNGQFSVPPLGLTVPPADEPPQPAPLVVLTSNDARQLPPALLRRCVVLPLTLPEDLQAHLIARGLTHYPAMNADVLAEAATQIIADRRHCGDGAITGLAEYLDLLRTLDRLARDDPQGQLAWLDKLGGYFRKSGAVAA